MEAPADVIPYWVAYYSLMTPAVVSLYLAFAAISTGYADLTAYLLLEPSTFGDATLDVVYTCRQIYSIKIYLDSSPAGLDEPNFGYLDLKTLQIPLVVHG